MPDDSWHWCAGIGASRTLCIIGVMLGLREDHSQLRMGHAPHLLAMLSNTVLGVLARQGVSNVAEERRQFAYQIDRALHSLAS
jgi:hypothetical protein